MQFHELEPGFAITDALLAAAHDAGHDLQAWHPALEERARRRT